MFDLTIRSCFWLIFSAAGALLAGCSSVDSASNRLVNIVSPYKIDIVQGNFVSSEQVAALHEGMTRNQVKNILGTPLLNDIFHAERWDYIFTFKRQGLKPQARKVTVFFKDDVLQRIDADPLPTEAEFVASLDSGRSSAKVPVLELSPERLKALSATKPAASSAKAQAQPAPLASYPPLEAASR